jgi:hypothetical protein
MKHPGIYNFKSMLSTLIVMKPSEPLGNLRKPYSYTEYTFGIISLVYLLKLFGLNMERQS